MITLSYGQLPDRATFVQCRNAATQAESPKRLAVYRMTIRSAREWSILADAINVGIDSHLEAVVCTADASTGEIEIADPASLHTLIRRLAEGDGIEGHECDDACSNERWAGEVCPFAGAADLASSILYTLGYEWI